MTRVQTAKLFVVISGTRYRVIGTREGRIVVQPATFSRAYIERYGNKANEDRGQFIQECPQYK